MAGMLLLDLRVQSILNFYGRGGTRKKFWGELQLFITYAYELYEFTKE